MSGSDLESFKSAVQTLYGHDQAAQKQANQWLTAFGKTPGAWDVCLTLLDPAMNTELLFFCGQMLLNKVRTEWSKLSADQRTQLTSAVSAKLEMLAQNPNVPQVVPPRICLVLASMAALSGGNAARQFLEQGFAMANASQQQGPRLLQYALTFLTSLAEEVDELDRGRRQAVLPILSEHMQKLVALTQSVVSAYNEQAATSLPYATAIHCLHTWLRLDPSGGGTCILSPGEFYSTSEPLLTALLTKVIEAPDEQLVESATDLLTEVLGPGRSTENLELEANALRAALNSLLVHRARVSAAGDEHYNIARAVSMIASAIAERDAGLITSNAELTTSVAHMLLNVAARSERSIMEVVLDYFIMINTVPVSERHPWLIADVYSNLMPHVFRHACYPENFNGWADCEEDEESFHRFREQSLVDCLDSCYAMLKYQFLTSLFQLSHSSNSWQQFEGTVFCLRAVHTAVKAKALGRFGDLSSESPQVRQEAQEVNHILQSFFDDICGSQGSGAKYSNNPWACQAVAQLIGEYAAWFGKCQTAPLEGALRFLLHALHHSQSWKQAASAFRSICVRCADRLKDVTVLSSLMTVAEGLVAPLPTPGQPATPMSMDHEDRAAVIEGLSRVVAHLPSQDAAEAGLRLIQPLVIRAQSLAHGAMDRAQLNILAAELRLIAAALRFMEFPGEIGAGVAHPALRVLEGAWSLVGAVTESSVCHGCSDVVEALCEVYQRTLLSAKGATRPLLGTLISNVLSVFRATRHPACLDTLATVVELFGEVKSNPEVAGVQEQALASVSEMCFETFQANAKDVSNCAELIRGLVSLCDRYLVFSRDMLLQSPALPGVISWAITAVGLHDRDPISAALAFLTHLVVLVDKLGGADTVQYKSRLDSCFSGQGEQLVVKMMVAAGDTCPRHLLRPLAGLLYSLLSSPSYGEAATRWLVVAMQSPDLPGVKEERVRGEDCHRFCTLAAKRPALQRGRFDAMVQDMASICRGEATGDVLLAYEM